MSNEEDVKRYLENRQKEIDGSALYLALAGTEKQPQMAEVYRKLSASEEKHAAAWDHKLEKLGVKPPPRKPSWRASTMIWLAQKMGPQFVLPTIAGNEKADSRAYDGQPEDEAKEFSSDERSHARMISMASNAKGGLPGGSVAQMEGRHRGGGGNALRAAVLGANDGLVSILSLVMGVAGATKSNSAVLIAALAGLLAGAGSMALGEWLSVQSSRELYENQIKIEAEEIAANPEEEMEELSLIYQSKGLPEDRARELAAAEGRPAAEPVHYTPACAEACPHGAITFGNRLEEGGPIAALEKKPEAFRLLEALGTAPKVTYLSREPWIRRIGLSRLDRVRGHGDGPEGA